MVNGLLIVITGLSKLKIYSPFGKNNVEPLGKLFMISSRFLKFTTPGFMPKSVILYVVFNNVLITPLIIESSSPLHFHIQK